MVAIGDYVSVNVLIVAFFTALFSSSIDQYPTPISPAPRAPQFELRTVAQEARYAASQSALALFSPSSPVFAHVHALFPETATAAPQALAQSADGRAFVGLADGRVAWFYADDRELKLHEFARTGRALPECGRADATRETSWRCGRVVGLAFAPARFLSRYVTRIPQAELFADEQVLLAADAFRGVYLLDARGRKTVLFNSVDKSSTLRFVSALAVSARGDVFVTRSSRKFAREQLVLAFLEAAEADGQVLHFSPRTGEVAVLADGLAFPNGLALVDNDSALLVALTAQHKVVKFTFTTGTLADFAFAPGEPSGLSLGSVGGKDLLFVGLFAPASTFDDFVMRSVKVRRVLSLLPEWVTLRYLKLRSVFATVDLASGDVLQVYEEKLGAAPWISSVHQLGG
ncbi:hypothetical protein PybrP1_000079 [[Pythium] brassicae (nom. inval.)]|nr:hypothetical protein PybrP1_000079 [[Pythium] brassicae (nom. inval.)]